MQTSERIWRLVTAGLGLGTVVIFGAIGESGADGGFIKDIWGAVKTASPLGAMVTTYGCYVIWKEWQRDRKEHADRTNLFNKTLNRYARLLESAVTVRESRRGR
jgi:hypothetical protein